MNGIEICTAVRQQRPLVHCISNIVTANDCANLALTVGASPIMAQASQEMEAISGIANAVVLNTGTPDEEKFKACRLAGITANRRGIPVILDPVGVGASTWRAQRVTELLDNVHPDLIHGNNSEILALLHAGRTEHGVDAAASEISGDWAAKELAKKLGCTVLLSAVDDIVTDGTRLERVTGGSARMKSITGAGCMLAVLSGVFAAVDPDTMEAAAFAARFWKACAGEAEKASGLGHFHMALFDAAETFSLRGLPEE